MKIDVYIDLFTDCLIDFVTGKESDTEYSLVEHTITSVDAQRLK